MFFKKKFLFQINFLFNVLRTFLQFKHSKNKNVIKCTQKENSKYSEKRLTLLTHFFKIAKFCIYPNKTNIIFFFLIKI